MVIVIILVVVVIIMIFIIIMIMIMIMIIIIIIIESLYKITVPCISNLFFMRGGILSLCEGI